MSARSVLASIAALLVALLTVVAGGCGGSASADSAGAPAEVAKLVPASSPLYVELDTNVDDLQWSRALALAKRFPAYDQLEAEFAKELSEAKLDFETDIKPLLGGRAALAAGEVVVPSGIEGATGDLLDQTGFLAVLQLEEGKDADVLALITRDGDLTKRGQREGIDYYADDEDTFGAVADGFLAIADSEENLFAALDRIGGSGDALSDVDKFKDALGGLPEGAIARMYVDIGRLVEDSLASVDEVNSLGFGLQDLEKAAMGAALITEENGVRLKGTVVGADGGLTDAAAEFTPGLAAQLPGDAVAYVGFADLAGQLAAVIDQLESAQGGDVGEQLSQAAGQLDALLGVSVDDLRALASGEHAAVVTADDTKVGVAAVLEVEDGARASATLDSLRQALPGLAGLAGGQATNVPQFRPAPLAGGVSGWELPLDDDFSLVYGVDGNKVLLGSSPGAVRGVQSPTPSLAENPGFVTDTAGIPDTVTGLVWIDMQGALDLIETHGDLDAEDRAGLAQIEPLKSVVAWSTGGSEPGFEVFARIE
jgi:hypothetical protein